MCASDATNEHGTPDRYAVIGHPIAHSLSPTIHAEFARQTGEPVEYGLLDAEPADFDDAVAAFFADGGRGLNVTAPHKAAAFGLCDSVTMRARVAGAVNTLWRTDDATVHGDVTDGDGLLCDLRDHLGLTLRDLGILVLGAGGSVAGCLAPLLATRPVQLIVANRTVRKAEKLAVNFAGFGDVEPRALNAIPDTPFDLVINATTASLTGESLDIPAAAARGALCYDLTYAPDDTPFTAWAAQHGARAAHTGIGMLVEQAALSFELWRGVRPATDSVRDLLAREHGFRF